MLLGLLQSVTSKSVMNKLMPQLMLCALFGFIYYFVSKTDGAKADSELSDLSTAMYFSIITHTTVGYGDILPKSKIMRILVGVHVLLVLGVSLS